MSGAENMKEKKSIYGSKENSTMVAVNITFIIRKVSKHSVYNSRTLDL